MTTDNLFSAAATVVAVEDQGYCYYGLNCSGGKVSNSKMGMWACKNHGSNKSDRPCSWKYYKGGRWRCNNMNLHLPQCQ